MIKNRIAKLTVLLAVLTLTSCTIIFPPSSPEETPVNPNLSAAVLFPFDNTTNIWYFSEINGNQLSISVVDTITDNTVRYYKIRFYEHIRTTQDIWFRRSSIGVEYSTALTGTFSRLLPSSITSRSGSFTSGNSTVSYAYKDTALVSGGPTDATVRCTYPSRIFQGFDNILFAEAYGITQLVDLSGRIPFIYSVDSCIVGGQKIRF